MNNKYIESKCKGIVNDTTCDDLPYASIDIILNEKDYKKMEDVARMSGKSIEMLMYMATKSRYLC